MIMRKLYEIPEVDVVRFEMSETLTSDPEQMISGVFDYGEGVEEW